MSVFSFTDEESREEEGKEIHSSGNRSKIELKIMCLIKTDHQFCLFNVSVDGVFPSH